MRCVLQSKSAKSTAQVSNGWLLKGLVKIVTGWHSRLKVWLKLEKNNDFWRSTNFMAADLQLDTEWGAQLRKIRLVGG